MATWIDVEYPGIFRSMGRKDDDAVGRGVMYGSSSVLHMTIVPPCDLQDSIARLGDSVSSLFSSKAYCPWKWGVRRGTSQ